jgi:lipooligosaccharide transport system ATP-binding protein
MDDAAIIVKNVYKNYGSLAAVKNLSFSVSKSHCFGILGPNGAGKTTMMKMLYGKARRDKGEVSVLGYDPKHCELEIKYISGIVPQEDNLDDELTVIQNLLVYSKFYGLKKNLAMERIKYLLDFMELSEKINSPIRALSGGMKRRLTIARALLNNPQILILDEPTTGLDPQVRHLIWDKIRMLQKEGVTVLITTHYMEEAFQLCDSLILMDKGIKILEGNPSQLILDNIEKYVLEIWNDPDIEKKISVVSIRIEKANNLNYCYSNNLNDLEKLSKDLKTGDFYLRQSNLEDVFLKTTGRGLHEE